MDPDTSVCETLERRVDPARTVSLWTTVLTFQAADKTGCLNDMTVLLQLHAEKQAEKQLNR